MRTTKQMLQFIFFMVLSLVMMNAHAQTGLNFQGVARTTNNVILASQAITIKLSILQGSATGTAEYTETRKVTTNAQGLFTAVIGDTGAISTLGNFTTINWKNMPKFLKIEMDASAGTNFITMGTTQFQYVAYAQFAKSVDAENIVGIVPVTLGGTGVNSLTGLKTALALNNVNNTTDLTKPISTLTQTALDLKLNAADTSKYTKQIYSDSALLTKLSTTGNATTATTAGNITATTNTTLTSLSNLATVGTITSGVWSGTAVSVEKGGTGATTVSAARTNLGLVIGTNVQAPLVAGTDYLIPTGSAASLTNFPTFNQNTTGNASTATTAGNITATSNTTLTSLSNLATVGTITSGVWSGTAVAVEKGGTGLTAAGTSGQVLTSTGSGTLTWTGTHYIGESYGGGIVFYVYDNGKHGLIAATSDQSTSIRWFGGTYTNTRARGDGVGAGLKNTSIIIAVQSGIYTPIYDGSAFAATVCNEYAITVDGVKYGDWYLPSIHELNLMYTNIGQGASSPNTNIGGFANNLYWSSTEDANQYAWSQNFSNGLQFRLSAKLYTYYVRAIRAF